MRRGRGRLTTILRTVELLDGRHGFRAGDAGEPADDGDRQGFSHGRCFGLTPSGTGIRLNLGGCLGVTLGWVEDLKVNILGGVAGLDLRRPALKLPGLGRLGSEPARRFRQPRPIQAG